MTDRFKEMISKSREKVVQLSGKKHYGTRKIDKVFHGKSIYFFSHAGSYRIPFFPAAFNLCATGTTQNSAAVGRTTKERAATAA